MPALRRLRKACDYAALGGRERLASYFYWLGPDKEVLPGRPQSELHGQHVHAHGVEVRVPLLGEDLVALAARLPNGMKQRGRTGKWVLKKVMEPYLPHDVIYRPKSSFGAPLRRWMRHDLRELLGDVLSAESLKRRGLFEPVAVQLRAACGGRCVRCTASMRVTLYCRCYASTSGAGRSSTGSAAYQRSE